MSPATMLPSCSKVSTYKGACLLTSLGKWGEEYAHDEEGPEPGWRDILKTHGVVVLKSIGLASLPFPCFFNWKIRF